MKAEIVSTVYGQMLVHPLDFNQTGALRRTSRAIDHNEITMLQQIAESLDNPVFHDIGACFGTYSLALAPSCRLVYAFEPQRPLAHMIAGTMALNGILNVHIHNVAIGDSSDTFIEAPQFDYNKALNFGSVEFGPEQQEPLTQERGNDRDKREFVPLVKLDDLAISGADIIKLDVEGMEIQAVRGMKATLCIYRPLLFVELIKSDREELLSLLASFGYNCHDFGADALCLPNGRNFNVEITKK